MIFCDQKNNRKMKLSLLFIFPILWKFECLAKPVEGTDSTVVEVTPYPDAQKQYIDINNVVSPEVTKIINENNLNLDQIKTMHAKLQNKTKGTFYHMIPTSTYSAPTAPKDLDEEMRLSSIRKSLEKTLRENGDTEHQSNAEFDYTLAAVCEVPRAIDIKDWFNQKTWNIYFKPNYRQYNVKSVILRIFKVATAGSKSSKECPDVEEFFKLTVSVYERKLRKEMIRKKIIFTQMIPKNFNGWIEIDALSTLMFWGSSKNNLGMAIDVYDKNETQLDAREHFHLQNCEAGPQIPWRAFKLFAETYRTPVSEDAVEVYRNVYTGPRLDLTSSNPANYFANSAERTEQQMSAMRSSRHLRHTHHHHHLQRTSDEMMEISNRQSHQTSARDHSHRSNSKVEET